MDIQKFTRMGNTFKTSKQKLTFGFGLILIIMLSLIVVWVSNIVNNSRNIQSVAQFQAENLYVNQMLEMVHTSKSLLLTISATNKPEFIDATIKISNLANDLYDVEKQYLDLELIGQEQQKWNEIRIHLDYWMAAQNETLELLQSTGSEDAFLLKRKLTNSYQSSLVNKFHELIGIHKTEFEELSQNISEQNSRSILSAFLLGVLALSLGFVVARKLVISIDKAQSALMAANEKALSADKAKSSFLANMSHEIRTPLTSIIGFAEALQYDDMSKSNREKSTNIIIKSSKHLLHIINEILDLSKIESEQLNIEKIVFSPSILLQESIETYKKLAERKNLQLVFECDQDIPAEIYGDPTRTKQIIYNLLSNAIKFSDKGEIFVNCQYDGSNFITISVRDQGVGISEEALRNIFVPFQQADISTTRKYGGTGLGLSISKQLAELMGGDLIVHSQPERGSEFILTLKLNSSELAFDDDKIPTPVYAEKTIIDIPLLCGNVLVAEDNSDTQTLIEFLINRTGAKVTLVDNGQKAIEEALKKHYDLILMDMQMPVMDGMDATVWIRKAGCKTPVVAFTANSSKEDLDRYKWIGINEIISKPVNKSHLYNTLETYLDNSENQKEKFCLDNDDEYIQMLSDFKNNIHHYTRSVSYALTEKNAEKLRSAAHKLKGISGSFGFDNIAKIANKIEELAKQHDFIRASIEANKLNTVCEQMKT